MSKSSVFSFMVLLLAGVIISLSGESFAREVEVNSSQVTLDYGVREYNEVFYDTLQFTAKEETETRLLSLDEVEVTCDCIEASILHRQQSGQSASFLAFTFHVDPEEPSGPGEKILYLYTKDNVYDLIRLVLRYSIGDSAGTNDSNQNRVEEQRPESGNTNAPLPALVDEARKHQPVLLYFGSSTCQSCRRVEEVVLPRLRERFGDELYLLKINIQQPDGFQYLLQVREQYGVTDKRSPFAFFIGKEAITGRSNLMSRLEIAVEKAVTDRSVTILPVPALETNRKAREVFRSISFWALVSAGLIDGINPCAFATLIFSSACCPMQNRQKTGCPRWYRIYDQRFRRLFPARPGSFPCVAGCCSFWNDLKGDLWIDLSLSPCPADPFCTGYDPLLLYGQKNRYAGVAAQSQKQETDSLCHAEGAEDHEPDAGGRGDWSVGLAF